MDHIAPLFILGFVCAATMLRCDSAAARGFELTPDQFKDFWRD
jgi:hypothetical protein